MKNLRKSLGTRLFIIAFLTLILLIPSLLIQGLISEREYRRDSVANEISQKWGDEQVVVGPIISVPYRYYFNGEDKVEQTIRYAHFLPENLNVEGAITTEIRYRGIYKVIVYNSSLSVSGNFPAIDLNGFKVPVEDFLIEDAFVSVGISDMTGIKDFVNIKWNESEFLANPGIESNDVLASGISIAPDLTTG